MATAAEPLPQPARTRRRSQPAPEPLPPDDEPTESPRRRYVRPGERQSSKVPLFAGLLGALALCGAVAAVVVFLAKNTEAPQAKNEKKDDSRAGEPLAKASAPQPATPGPEPGAAILALPPHAKTFQFRPPAGKLQLLQSPTGKVFHVETPFEKVKRVFPPLSRSTHDAIVIWQTNPGAGGRGERLTVDTYSGMIGARTGRFEIDGDGKEPRCDVSADGRLFAAAGADGKLGVWNLTDNTKPLEGFDPYADLPEHKKAGLAAVFFAADPNNLVTVSTAGAVHLIDTTTKRPLGELMPPKATPGRVVVGKSAGADESRASVVVLVGGVIYQIATAAPLAVVWTLDLEGEVSRPLGLAVFGTPGRVALAFETEADKKKQRGLLLCLPNGRPALFPWPDAAGEPTGAAWAGAKFAVVATTRGALWVEAEDKQFTPLALCEVAGGKALHATTEPAHWYLLPDPADAAKSVLVELTLPPDGLLDFRAAAEAGQPLHTVRLDDKGLWK
jgi:hypothetical protein